MPCGSFYGAGSTLFAQASRLAVKVTRYYDMCFSKKNKSKQKKIKE